MKVGLVYGKFSWKKLGTNWFLCALSEYSYDSALTIEDLVILQLVYPQDMDDYESYLPLCEQSSSHVTTLSFTKDSVMILTNI